MFEMNMPTYGRDPTRGLRVVVSRSLVFEMM